MLDHTRPARGPVQPAVAHTNCEWVLYPNLDLAQTDFFWAQTMQNYFFVCVDPKNLIPTPQIPGKRPHDI